MSKKTLLLCLCIVATLVIGLGSTLAYLTDSDTKVNTFTVGNVDIMVDEDFEQNSPLAPGATVNKDAQIVNTGATPAWVWMTVAVPSNVAPYLQLNWADGVQPDGEPYNAIGDDGNEYMVYTVYVDQELAAGEETGKLLDSVTLSSAVDYQNGEFVVVENGVVTPIGEDLSELDVIVSGYAVQTEGFDTVGDAYDAYHAQWQDDTIPTEASPEPANGDDEEVEFETPAGITRVTTPAELEAAVKNGATEILLADGEYNANMNALNGKTLKLYGESKNVVLYSTNEGEQGADYDFDGATVEFYGITFDSSKNTGGSYPGYARLNGTYKDCAFKGQYTCYGNSKFDYCTFDITGDKYNLWTWGAPSVTMDHCTFNCDGKAVLLYGQANTKLSISNSVFNDSDALDVTKTAVEIGNDYNKSYELTLTNVDVNGFAENPAGIPTGTTLWSNKNSMSSDKLNVVVDGTDVY